MPGKYLNLKKRREIERLRADDKSPTEIAGVMGVTTATIYRELHRGEKRDESGAVILNEHGSPAYDAETAERNVRASMRSRGRRRLAR